MATFKVSKAGYDAPTARVDQLLIDSDYASLLAYSYGSSSISVPSSGGATQTFAIPGSWLPYGIFLTDQDVTGHTTVGKYYFQKNNGGAGFAVSGWTPIYSGGNYTGWEYVWNSTGSTYTANYIYYITYLQSDGSYNNSTALSNTAPYINISIPGVDATTTNVRQLAFTTQVPMVGIVQENAGGANITLSGTGNGGVLEMSFAHGLGKVVPFTGFVTNSTTHGASTINFSTLCTSNLQGPSSETYDFAMDTTNFYVDIRNSVNAQSYSVTLHVFFIQLPS